MAKGSVVMLPSSWTVASLVGVLTATALVACGNSDQEVRTDITIRRSEAIIGGQLDTNPDHDGVVGLAVIEGYGMSLCTGSLISQPGQKGVVVTARHCVSHVVSEFVSCGNDVGADYDASAITVGRGYDPMSNMRDSVIGVGERLFHRGGASLCGNDVAVLVLNKVVNDFIPLRVRTDMVTEVGEKFTSIGYGQTSELNQNSAGRRFIRENVTVTRLGPVPMITLAENEFMGTTSICQGDSGGPAISQNYALMGVTSRGASCNGSDNIWGSVPYFMDIIGEAIEYAEASYQDENGNEFGPAASNGEEDAGSSETPDGSGDGSFCDPGCGPGQTCVEVPGEPGNYGCGTTCESNEDCTGDAYCHERLRVCTLDNDVASKSGCSVAQQVSASRNHSTATGIVLLLTCVGLAARRRRTAA